MCENAAPCGTDLKSTLSCGTFRYIHTFKRHGIIDPLREQKAFKPKFYAAGGYYAQEGQGDNGSGCHA